MLSLGGATNLVLIRTCFFDVFLVDMTNVRFYHIPKDPCTWYIKNSPHGSFGAHGIGGI